MTIFLCEVCQSKDVVAVKPGCAPEIVGSLGFVIDRGEPSHAWCMAHWPCRPPSQGEPR
jgi:hypothetical protein